MKPLHCVVLLAAAVATVSADKQFRSDYEYSSQAQGWLKFHKSPAPWWIADLQCYYEGGVLASPINNNLKDAMNSLIQQSNEFTISGVHTGIYNRYIGAPYTSVEGIPLSEMPMQHNEMASTIQGATMYCMRMFLDRELFVSECNSVLPYICYKKYTGDLKQTECGTVDKGYQLNKITGHCYKFHNNTLQWSYAYMACAAEGGHLAIINSEAEAQVIKELFAKYPAAAIKRAANKHAAFIGYVDSHGGGEWRTIHGQSLESAGYDNWFAVERDFSNLKEYCGGITRDGSLTAIACHQPSTFICEKDPNSLRV